MTVNGTACGSGAADGVESEMVHVAVLDGHVPVLHGKARSRGRHLHGAGTLTPVVVQQRHVEGCRSLAGGDRHGRGHASNRWAR